MTKSGTPYDSIEDVLGYDVYNLSTTDLIDEVFNSLGNDSDVHWAACLNPHSYAVANSRPSFIEALDDADWLVPDGVGVVYASRILGGDIRERITGFDIFRSVLERINNTREPYSVFFLGSTEQVLSTIENRLAKEYPCVRLAGSYSPPFRQQFSDKDVADMISAVNASSADILWLGFTAPKQEELMLRLKGRVDVRFAAAIGAVFDFYAGRIRRSHPAWQRLGLEWLPRLIQEPRRLWRRTFVSAPVFVWHVLLQRLGLHPGKSRAQH